MYNRALANMGAVIAMLALGLTACGKPPAGSILYHDKAGMWSMKPDGSRANRLTDFGWWGAFSPDNSRIAFGKAYSEGIWVADADGSNPSQLTDFGFGPSWSPDGSKLAFHSGGAAGRERRIWIMNADGSDAHRISTVSGSFPRWSPSGDRLLFHGEVNSGIWQIAPDGTAQALLYRDGGYPAWSPDGKQIAYVDLRDWCIWVMDADGTDARKLTSHKGLQPTWSPDGQQIAYEASRSAGKKGPWIWTIRLDGSEDRAVREGASGPDWSN